MSTTDRGNARIVRPDGDRLDVVNAVEFRAELLGAIDAGSLVVVDLGGIEFIDSSGLGVLVSALKAQKTRDGGELRLAALRPNVRQLLEIIRLDRVFALYPSVEEAAE